MPAAASPDTGHRDRSCAGPGHHVVGVGISDEAIEHARRTAAAADLDVELVRAEMREIPRNGCFDAA